MNFKTAITVVLAGFIYSHGNKIYIYKKWLAYELTHII